MNRYRSWSIRFMDRARVYIMDELISSYISGKCNGVCHVERRRGLAERCSANFMFVIVKLLQTSTSTVQLHRQFIPPTRTLTSNTMTNQAGRTCWVFTLYADISGQLRRLGFRGEYFDGLLLKKGSRTGCWLLHELVTPDTQVTQH